MKQETIDKVFTIVIDNEIDLPENIISAIKKKVELWTLPIWFITSRPFIDSFCKYLWDTNKYWVWGHYHCVVFLKQYWEDDEWNYSKDYLNTDFRHKLADAIYNDTLEDFFTWLID